MDTQRFILIDDESVANMLAELSVKRIFANADIYKFTDPEAGLHFIKEENNRPAVVFLDINMPKLSGWDVLDTLQNYPGNVAHNISVYIVSSSIDPEDKQKAYAYPCVKAFVEKPMTKAIVQSLFVGEEASRL